MQRRRGIRVHAFLADQVILAARTDRAAVT